MVVYGFQLTFEALAAVRLVCPLAGAQDTSRSVIELKYYRFNGFYPGNGISAKNQGICMFDQI